MQSGDLRSDAGLSLIEIMVALFIVGLASSFVVLSLPRSPTPLIEVRGTLDRLLNSQRTEAILGGAPRGLLLEENEVRVLVFDRGLWRAPTGLRDTPVFALHPDTEVVLEGDDEPVFQTTQDDDAPVVPDIWFDPSGFATEASLELNWRNQSVGIDISQTGEVTIHDASR